MAFISANFFAIFLILAFVAAVLLLEGLYSWWNATRSPEARKLERRLHALAAGAAPNDESSILKQRLLSGAPQVERLLFALPRLRLLDRMLEQSGLPITVGRLLTLCACSGIAALVVMALLPVPGIAMLAVGAFAAALPLIYVKARQGRRLRRIDRQLPDALDLICRALRAGHAFSSGLQMVGEEMPDPIAAEFRIMHEEVNFGVSLQQALMNLGARIPSTDIRYFVVAVMIQRESGGNLTEVLGNLAALIRERYKLFEKVRVLSAEGRLSAWILALLPFVVGGVINLINPSFMQALWSDPMGTRMVGMALTGEVIGILWMRRIVRIRV